MSAPRSALGGGRVGTQGRVLRFRRFRWQTVPVEHYKTLRVDGGWTGINRQVLVAGSRGAPMAFDVRYFEIEPGGRSSLEAHDHIHVVIGLRGDGHVRLGRRWFRLRQFDVCYIGPDETHQLRNEGTEPFGFLCLVNSERDAPRTLAAVAGGNEVRPGGRGREPTPISAHGRTKRRRYL